MACLLLVAVVGTLAQHWTVNARAWQYDMTVYAQLKVNGQAVSDYADYEVAAFCRDECRGVAKVLLVEDEKPLLYLRIYSNAISDETITFRVYQASTDDESRLEEKLVFDAQAVAGTPGEPMMLTQGNVLLGDANGDGEVNTKDVVAISDYMMGKNSGSFKRKNADVNGDGVINIADIIQITKQILSKE